MPIHSPIGFELSKENREKLATLGQRYLKAADPTVNDDTGEGYAVWDKWLNQTSGEAYVCTDATEGAAVWQNISLDADDLSSLFDAKADKDADAVAGNLPKLVSGGGYEDSGFSALMFTTQSTTATTASTAIDMDSGYNIVLTLEADTTLSFSNVPNSSEGRLSVIQDATGGRVITWPGTLKWPHSIELDLSTTAAARDEFIWQTDASGNMTIFLAGAEIGVPS